jgi:hypothetical protein
VLAFVDDAAGVLFELVLAVFQNQETTQQVAGEPARGHAARDRQT